ncbi:MAG TPA: hypothetical protein VMZ02_02040 [Candidatus Limnocylindrales bacterium]|nr:hypothetical protein [Candidatus Limnocylindrales bacterium]
MRTRPRALAMMFSLGFLLPIAGFSQGPQRNQRSAAVDSELARSRAEVLQKTKETRAGAERLLALHEAELKRVTEEYEQRRELYYQGLISRVDVIQAEERVAKTTLLIRDDKRFLAETDTALTEFTMRDELFRLPGLALGGYSETASLLRFNGAAGFTLAEVAKIERFFTSTFGRGLPISALGQTSTHDRMRFDHRNAVDVALHPESAEGQSVLNFLRQAGIPFIAFRAAVPGAATGAHIHIGKPSPRL